MMSMGMRCPRPGCSAHLELGGFDGPVICSNGHPISVVNDHVQEFLKRATSGVEA